MTRDFRFGNLKHRLFALASHISSIVNESESVDHVPTFLVLVEKRQ